MGIVGEAFEIALFAHAGQTDKLGEPYITHVVRVAARLESDMERVVGLLHDVIEDTPISSETLRSRFGDEITNAVIALTKPEGADYDAYLLSILSNPLALAVKRADLADNSDENRLARLDTDQRSRLKKKYAQAHAILGFREADNT